MKGFRGWEKKRFNAKIAEKNREGREERTRCHMTRGYNLQRISPVAVAFAPALVEMTKFFKRRLRLFSESQSPHFRQNRPEMGYPVGANLHPAD